MPTPEQRGARRQRECRDAQEWAQGIEALGGNPWDHMPGRDAVHSFALYRRDSAKGWTLAAEGNYRYQAAEVLAPGERYRIVIKVTMLGLLVAIRGDFTACAALAQGDGYAEGMLREVAT